MAEIENNIILESVPKTTDTLHFENFINIFSSKNPPNNINKELFLSLKNFLQSKSSIKRKTASSLILYLSSLSIQNLNLLKERHLLIEQNGYVGVSLFKKKTIINPDFFITTLKNDPKFRKEAQICQRFFYKFMKKNGFGNGTGKINVLTLTEIQYFLKASSFRKIPDPLYNTLWYFNHEYFQHTRKLSCPQNYSSPIQQKKRKKTSNFFSLKKNQKFFKNRNSKSVVVRSKKLRIRRNREKSSCRSRHNSVLQRPNSQKKRNEEKRRKFRSKSVVKKSQGRDFLICKPKKKILKEQSQDRQPLFKTDNYKLKNNFLDKKKLLCFPQKKRRVSFLDQTQLNKRFFDFSGKNQNSSRNKIKDFFIRKKKNPQSVVNRYNTSINNNC